VLEAGRNALRIRPSARPVTAPSSPVLVARSIYEFCEWTSSLPASPPTLPPPITLEQAWGRDQQQCANQFISYAVIRFVLTDIHRQDQRNSNRALARPHCLRSAEEQHGWSHPSRVARTTMRPGLCPDEELRVYYYSKYSARATDHCALGGLECEGRAVMPGLGLAGWIRGITS
jgi:hypothetical protein